MINQNIEKIKEAFFSQLSHNLMTHASNIIGFSELMKNEELRQEDKLQYIQFVIELSNMILTPCRRREVAEQALPGKFRAQREQGEPEQLHG